MNDRKILANWIMCPDGVMLPSFSTHDFRQHGDTAVDGGLEYLRRVGNYVEMSVFDDDPHEVIRRFVCRGTSGKNGDKPFHWIPIFKMSDEYLKATIEWNKTFGREGNRFNVHYHNELEYRKNHGITIKDYD